MKDLFRKKYHPLSEDNAQYVLEIKEKAEELLLLFSRIKSREMSLAVTNLEQAVMWSSKAIVLDDEEEKMTEKGEI